MEARGRLLIIGASHPVDLFSYSFFLLRNSSIAVTGEKQTICFVEDTQPAPSKPRPCHSLQPILWFPPGLKGIAQAYSLFMFVNFHISLHLVAYSWDSRPSGLRLSAIRKKTSENTQFYLSFVQHINTTLQAESQKILLGLWQAVFKVGGLHTVILLHVTVSPANYRLT